MAPDRTTYLVFDPDRGTIVHRAEQRDPERLWSRQLNAIDWSTEGRTAPTMHHTVHQGFRPEAITQEMLALYRDRVDPSLLPNGETPPLLVTSSMPDSKAATSRANTVGLMIACMLYNLKCVGVVICKNARRLFTIPRWPRIYSRCCAR